MKRTPLIAISFCIGWLLCTLSTLRAQQVVATDFQCPYCGLNLGLFQDVSAGQAALQRHLATCPRAPHATSSPSFSSGGNFTPQQQMMLNTAGSVGYQAGYQLGQGLANLFFGNNGPSDAEIQAQKAREEAARQEAIRQEQLRQEQLRLQRLQQAAKLRMDWDGRDQAMSDELSGVFSVPIGPQTAFFGVGGPPNGQGPSDPTLDDTSVVDLRDAPGGDLIDTSGDSSIMDLRGTSATDGDGIVPISLGEEPLSASGAGIAQGGPIFAPPPNPVSKAYTRGEIELQLRQAENGLNQITRSMQLDASQRREWEYRERTAFIDVSDRLLMGSLEVGFDGALEYSKAANQAQLSQQAVLITETANPIANFGPLHQEMMALEQDKQLLKDLSHGEEALHAANAPVAATEAYLEEGSDRLTRVGDAITDLSALGGPEIHAPISIANTMINGTYDAASWTVSRQRLSALNANDAVLPKAAQIYLDRISMLRQQEQSAPP